MATTLKRRDYLLRLLGNATPGTTDPVTDHLGRSVQAGNIDTVGRALTAAAWIAATAYAVGDLITVIASGVVLRCTVAGTSHATTAPVAPGYGLTVVDATVTWEQITT